MDAFWWKCLPARLFFAWLVYLWPRAGLLAILPALGFAYLAAFPSERTSGMAGQATWWAPWRWVHALLWGSAAAAPHPTAAAILTFDALLGAALKASQG